MRTLSIQLSDPVFDEAAREAAVSGRSVEEFVAEMVREGLHGADENAPFTPDQIAKVRRAQDEIAAGLSFTSEGVDDHFARRRAVWAESGRP